MILAKKKYHPFAFENTQNVVIFSVKVIFVERELLVQVDLSKSSTDNLQKGNFWGPPRGKFLSLIVQYIFGGNFTQYSEFYREEEAFFLSRIACFGPLDHSRLFRKVMTTPGPRCKPPANNIIELLTFTTDEMALSGKMVLSQSNFLH